MMIKFRKYSLIFQRILCGEIHRRFLLPVMVARIRTHWENATLERFQGFRDATLSFVSSNHDASRGVGFYSYVPGGPPLLYASCYAALIKHLYGCLDSFSQQERSEWTNYLLNHQSDDGLFRDPIIACPEAENLDWWGWRHLTVHALMALTALGGVAPKPFRLLDIFRKRGGIASWLERRDWKQDATAVSNEIQNYGTMLQYARDFQGESWCEDALTEMFAWLDQKQNPETGYWGYDSSSPWQVSLGVQTGYHLWCLYLYDGRPLQYIEQIIDSCLSTQNALGGFGVPVNSSACEDIDSLFPLVCLSFLSDYRRDDIERALTDAFFWIIANFNPDGGAVFRRGEDFRYGHDLMWTRANQSSMFATWFRTLSLAYASRVLSTGSLAKLGWGFPNCPGYQFWR